MGVAVDQGATAWAIGIDVSPARIVGGVVASATGTIVRRLEVAKPPRGAAAVAACAALGGELASSHRAPALGVALRDTVGCSEVELAARCGPLSVRTLSHDRAAALGEAHAGAGVGLNCFVYASIDETLSAVVVRHGVPWEGHCGPARAAAGPERSDTAVWADDLVAAGSRTATGLLTRAPRDTRAALVNDLGVEIGWLVDLTDPDGIIVGGALGLDSSYRRQWVDRMRRSVWDPPASVVPVVAAGLGADAALVGAALAAAQGSNTLLRNR